MHVSGRVWCNLDKWRTLTYKHMHTRTQHSHIDTHLCSLTHTYVCTNSCMHTHTFTLTYAHSHIHTPTYTITYAHSHIHTHTYKLTYSHSRIQWYTLTHYLRPDGLNESVEPVSCFVRLGNSNTRVQILVESNQWISNWYLSLCTQVDGIIRRGQGLVDSVSG